ncbi:MAG TPA: class I SAM-dependent methyltransferase [Planctomycetota bacterium]|nr:class I SAM-dependent methyltransferase [Planctomycetota bacterium]
MKLYSEFADWFRLLTPPADYRREAAVYAKLLFKHSPRRPRTLLELGSGGGHNASHLRRRFAMTLVDLSPAMLKASRRLNPGVEHLRGDMLTLRLPRAFDAVFIHDAIMHLATERDLRRAVGTAHAHLREGGAALFAPDFVRETFRPNVESGGSRRGGREVRWLGWDVDGVATIAYVMKGPGNKLRGAVDRFRFGLFSRATWMRVLRDEGFRPIRARAVDGRDAFIGIRLRTPRAERGDE